MPKLNLGQISAILTGVGQITDQIHRAEDMPQSTQGGQYWRQLAAQDAEIAAQAEDIENLARTVNRNAAALEQVQDQLRQLVEVIRDSLEDE